MHNILSRKEEPVEDNDSKELYEYMKLISFSTVWGTKWGERGYYLFIFDFLNIFSDIDQDAVKLGLYDEAGKDIFPRPWEVPDAHKLDNTSLGQYLDDMFERYQGTPPQTSALLTSYHLHN